MVISVSSLQEGEKALLLEFFIYFRIIFLAASEIHISSVPNLLLSVEKKGGLYYSCIFYSGLFGVPFSCCSQQVLPGKAELWTVTSDLLEKPMVFKKAFSVFNSSNPTNSLVLVLSSVFHLSTLLKIAIEQSWMPGEFEQDLLSKMYILCIYICIRPV